MSLAETSQPSPTTEARQSKESGVSILVIESFASTPLGPKIVFANEKAIQETGYEESSLVGSPLGLVYDRSDLRNLIEKLPIIAGRTGFCWMDRVLLRNGGSRDTMHWTIRPTQKVNGQTRLFTLTFKPIHDTPEPDSPAVAPASIPKEAQPSMAAPAAKQVPVTISAPDQDLEDDLQETRSESLAMAAGGVAHDFKNALQTIKSNVEIAQSLSGTDSRLSACLDDANHALDDAEMLARQMLAFTRGDHLSSTVFNVADQISRVSSLCTAGSRVSCLVNVDPGLRLVEGDPNRIYQVFHNLVINACQSMPNGGVLHLTVGNADLLADNPYSVSPGSYTVVSVRDRGCGIPPDVLPRIFEKNFSTKTDGSGFGLASCRAIVEAHQGFIRAASKVGVGTEFLVFLPSCQRAAESLKTADIPENRIGGSNVDPETGQKARNTSVLVPKTCRVLIVEDQAPVLKSTQGVLKHLGHDCLSAINGEEAVRTYRQHLDSAEPVDVVLLDMTLPGGLNGIEVYQELKKADPEVVVIATSGYFADGPNEAISKAGFPALLSKPFSIQDLSNTIVQVLS